LILKALLLKGNCLYKLNRQEEALKSYDKTLELNPNCIGALYNKGYWLTNGSKFGVDFLAYQRNPNTSHACFMVKCLENDEKLCKSTMEEDC